MCGYLCEYVHWQSVFYITGAIGILWFLVWALIVFDGPDVHPRISDQEKQFLQMSLKETQSEKPSSVPWKDIVMSAPVWAILVSHVTQSFGFYVLFTELPTYMKNVLNYDMSSKVHESIALSNKKRDLFTVKLYATRSETKKKEREREREKERKIYVNPSTDKGGHK